MAMDENFVEQLKGGQPAAPVAEYHLAMKVQIAMLKARVKAGDLSLPPGALERLEKMDASDRVGLLSSGVTEAKPEEIIEPVP